MKTIPQSDFDVIKQIIQSTKYVKNRIDILKDKGYDVQRCFVKDYNGIGGLTYYPRLNEIRMIIGRPNHHSVKEVYAIIIK